MSNRNRDELIDRLYGLLFQVCKVCQSIECREVWAGDEGWTVCPDCRAVEQGYSDAIERHDISDEDFEAAEAAGLLKDIVVLEGGE